MVMTQKPKKTEKNRNPIVSRLGELLNTQKNCANFAPPGGPGGPPGGVPPGPYLGDPPGGVPWGAPGGPQGGSQDPPKPIYISV